MSTKSKTTWNKEAFGLMKDAKFIEAGYVNKTLAKKIKYHFEDSTMYLLFKLRDGSDLYLYPSYDDEGNGAGSMFGFNKHTSGNFNLGLPVCDFESINRPF